MVRKTVSILIIMISVIMFYAGCDGDDGSMMDQAPGGSLDCANCPCDYSQVPMDSSCWETVTMGSVIEPTFTSTLTPPAPLCVLAGGATGVTIQASNRCEDASCENPVCRIIISNPFCGGSTNLEVGLDDEMEINACIGCLQEYAQLLNTENPVQDFTQGFSCSNPNL